MELTPPIKDYVLKKITNLEKLLWRIEVGKSEAMVYFEVARSTKHHKSGEIFHADCLINISGEEFYSSADTKDLYTAIDTVRENLFNEIQKHKDRKQTLFKRGAASIKKMLKGLSKRNPFTAKY